MSTSTDTPHPKDAREPGKKCPCTAEQREDFLAWVARLVHQHRSYLLRVVRSEGLGPEDAFDAVQEAFQTFLTLPAARAVSARGRSSTSPSGVIAGGPGNPLRVPESENGRSSASPSGVIAGGPGNPLRVPESDDSDAGKMLTTIARNAARNHRRRAAVARPHDSDDAVLAALATPASVEELLAEAEDEIRLRGCVESLGDMQRMVVTLRMLDEIAGEDVARTLGVTPGHVAVLLHRAKANLLACMTGPEAGSPAARS